MNTFRNYPIVHDTSRLQVVSLNIKKTGEVIMREQMNYDTFLKVANTISHSKEPE